MWHRLLLLGVFLSATTCATVSAASLSEFSSRLEYSLGDMSENGLGITELRVRTAESNQEWINQGRPQVGPAAPHLVRNKKFSIRVVNGRSIWTIADGAKDLLKSAPQDMAKDGTITMCLMPCRDLDYTSISKETIAKAKIEMAKLVPIARFGDFGLFAHPQVSPEQARDLEALVLKLTLPALFSGMNITGMTKLEPIQVAGLSYPATGAADLVAAMDNIRGAGPAAAAEPNTPPDGQRISGVRVGKDRTTTYYENGAVVVSETAPPASTVGPQIRGYDPAQADRPPPGLAPPKPTGRTYVKYGGWTTDSDREIERERKAREAQAAAAKKPRLTMADYAKKAEQEKADFQAKKARAAADNKAVLQWMLDGRSKREAQIRDAWQKRREYVDSQANRKDAVVSGKIFVEGGWVKIPLRNRTDVTMKVTIDYEAFNNKGERLGSSSQLTMLLALTSHDAILFGEEPGWRITDSRVSWVAERFEYENKVPVPY